MQALRRCSSEPVWFVGMREGGGWRRLRRVAGTPYHLWIIWASHPGRSCLCTLLGSFVRGVRSGSLCGLRCVRRWRSMPTISTPTSLVAATKRSTSGPMRSDPCPYGSMSSVHLAPLALTLGIVPPSTHPNSLGGLHLWEP